VCFRPILAYLGSPAKDLWHAYKEGFWMRRSAVLPPPSRRISTVSWLVDGLSLVYRFLNGKLKHKLITEVLAEKSSESPRDTNLWFGEECFWNDRTEPHLQKTSWIPCHIHDGRSYHQKNPRLFRIISVGTYIRHHTFKSDPIHAHTLWLCVPFNSAIWPCVPRPGNSLFNPYPYSWPCCSCGLA
jgi:hypothetical protein